MPSGHRRPPGVARPGGLGCVLPGLGPMSLGPEQFVAGKATSFGCTEQRRSYRTTLRGDQGRLRLPPQAARAEGPPRTRLHSPGGGQVRLLAGDQGRRRTETARVWDARTGTGLGILCVHEDWVEAIAWAPDGQRIATASRDRTARVWEATTDLEALIAKARQRPLRELTGEERTSAMLPR
jgi:WD40 repeat protein